LVETRDTAARLALVVLSGRDIPMRKTDIDLEVTVNDIPYLAWSGSQKELGVSAAHAMRDPTTVGITVHANSIVEFSGIRISSLPAAQNNPKTN
jgi:hypothetical protein